MGPSGPPLYKIMGPSGPPLCTQVLRHVVGQIVCKPIKANVEAIEKSPIPCSKKELQRCLGIAGHYRKFCSNFSDTSGNVTKFTR